MSDERTGRLEYRMGVDRERVLQRDPFEGKDYSVGVDEVEGLR